MKVKLFERSRFFYPDVLVTCNSQDDPKLSYVNFPKVIIEVLSDSTEKFDRGDKFLLYQSIPSLQEYILVSSDRHCVQCYRRWENDLWLLQTYQGETAITAIECLGISAPLSEIYATIDFSITDETNPA